ncbi:hypothetical protein F4781DRAFT_407883 [Annulohypoxylon bovei var. microspora]|nr:hypothetical protein F4781DRAFT_407883 [Annulohypoxylon bovei var. microspora]
MGSAIDVDWLDFPGIFDTNTEPYVILIKKTVLNAVIAKALKEIRKLKQHMKILPFNAFGIICQIHAFPLGTDFNVPSLLIILKPSLAFIVFLSSTMVFDE